jgi:hypothetical protein
MGTLDGRRLRKIAAHRQLRGLLARIQSFRAIGSTACVANGSATGWWWTKWWPVTSAKSQENIANGRGWHIELVDYMVDLLKVTLKESN